MEIDEGYTLDFLIHAFFVGVPGLILIYIAGADQSDPYPSFSISILSALYSVGVILPIISGLLISIKSGIQISTEQKRIRVYKSIFSKKFGTWINISTVKSAKLRLTNESQHLMSRGTEKTYATKTFDLFLIGNDDSEIEFHNFSDRRLALRALSDLKNQFDIQITDNTKGKVKRKN